MRNKKAKAIRRYARSVTIGFPAVAYNTRGSFKDAAGVIVQEPITMARCTRLVYKKLKRIA